MCEKKRRSSFPVGACIFNQRKYNSPIIYNNNLNKKAAMLLRLWCACIYRRCTYKTSRIGGAGEYRYGNQRHCTTKWYAPPLFENLAEPFQDEMEAYFGKPTKALKCKPPAACLDSALLSWWRSCCSSPSGTPAQEKGHVCALLIFKLSLASFQQSEKYRSTSSPRNTQISPQPQATRFFAEMPTFYQIIIRKVIRK